MLVKVVVYGFANGRVFSRQVARKLHEDVAFRVPAAENFPAHRTIREFRQLHRGALAGLFVQVVKLAHEVGLLKLGRVGNVASDRQASTGLAVLNTPAQMPLPDQADTETVPMKISGAHAPGRSV